VTGTPKKRAYGTGSLFQKSGSWYGKWWVGGRQVKRRLGRVRQPGSDEGLTRKQAEAALRRMMGVIRTLSPEERITFQQAADRYIHHVEHVMRRKRSTVIDYCVVANRHLGPYFGTTELDRITPDDVTGYIERRSREGFAVKTIINHLTFGHGVFRHAVKRGWCRTNPIAAADRPRAEPTDPDIRFLTPEELEALLRAASRDDALGPTDYALYMLAAMTGLRQGELVALRWRDIDWSAKVVRVRRNYTRGEWGTPKSRRSSRAVPLADRAAGELERHFQRSRYRGDDDLVFAHPFTGHPYDASRLRKRFYEAMDAAGMAHRRGRQGGITFHSLRHTFGTRMAAVGVPMRTLQEWMGHRDYTTTLVYADFAPDPSGGAAYAEKAFGTAPPDPSVGPLTAGSPARDVRP
jgi:integrase